jgi:integrative and conjugative element protein (TIGR02256 family)
MPVLRAPVLRRSLVLGADLAADVVTEAKRFAPLETGGVLLGFPDARKHRLRVTELVGAGPHARHESDRFEPDGRWQKQRIAERYAASGCALHYLGDWHSHPKGDGPSGLDRSTARLIADTPNAYCSHPVFLIATWNGALWELLAYRWASRRFRRIVVQELSRVERDAESG